MAVEKGAAFLLKAGDGGSPEGFATVAGLRTTSLAVNTQLVDVTTKDSAGWRELLAGAGVRRMTVAGAGVFTGGAAEDLLRSRVLDGTIANYRLQFESGASFVGAFQVAALDFAGNHDGERTYSVTLESSGAVTYAGG